MNVFDFFFLICKLYHLFVLVFFFYEIDNEINLSYMFWFFVSKIGYALKVGLYAKKLIVFFKKN